MSELINAAEQLRPAEAPSWLAEVHQKGRAIWSNAVWPGRKTERWRYTSLKALEQGGFFTPQALQRDASVAQAGLSDAYTIPELEAHRLVFVNGRFAPERSDVQALPDGVNVVTFGQANDEQQAVIHQYLDSRVESERHLFAALNSQLLADGVLVFVPSNCRLEKPVHVVWVSDSQQTPAHIAQRLLVVLEHNAQAEVLEHFASDASAQNCFTQGVTELYLGENAHLQHHRWHLEEEHALHIGGVHVALERGANLSSFHLAMGGKLKRIDVDVNFFGEGGHCEINGVYLPQRAQHVDYHTNIEHRVAHCTSRETFRGIVGDSARAVFNGRIHIHPNAQKTLAQLSNKNLLTSDKAEVDTKPELEIYADDVQCAHGATVAQLDETALHYLLTRGIDRPEAQVMLSFGFINELINTIRQSALADYLRPLLAQHFARDPKLMRHIA